MEYTLLELAIVKTGFESFDALHAYGLCVVLAETLDVEVRLFDFGLMYRLLVPETGDLSRHDVRLTDILALPASDNLALAGQVELANIDGLLAASFTSPGIRLVSVDDAMYKRRFDPEAPKAGLEKVNSVVVRLVTASLRRGQVLSVESILGTYCSSDPVVPTIQSTGAKDISVNMPIDAGFTFSTRRPLRDGAIGERTNMAVRGTPHAGILALVGAGRCLRAQRVGGDLVNLCVPIFSELYVRPGFLVPLLARVDFPAQQAAVVQLLSHYLACGSALSAISCQTLQPQGAKQSLSLSRTHMPTALLRRLEQAGLVMLLWRWRDYLSEPLKLSPLDQDLLSNAIVSQSHAAWRDHLCDVAREVNAHAENAALAYSMKEVSTMIGSDVDRQDPLSCVLEREHGTLRFGRSLRSLGELRRADLQDSLDEIGAARTRDQLLRGLATSTQKCVLAKTASNFVIVPNDTDLDLLLQDIDRWGVRDIAGLLILLSSLRYPYMNSMPDPDATVSSVNDFSI